MKENRGKRKSILAILLCLGIALYSALMGSKNAWAATGNVKINEANFPDDAFRALIAGPNYDRNADGQLDREEIRYTINIYCDNMGIRSLQGIEYFTDLQGLYCRWNQIESWDLSHNKELRGIWCSNNRFTSLDFSANKKLLWVYCYNCRLTKLNVSENPDMAYLECNDNPLKKLDVTKNTKLEHLICNSCQLKSLDLSHNPNLSHLDALRNEFKSLDVTCLPKLKRLDIWDNPGLGSVDVSKCPGLQYYNCAHNDVKSLDVSANPELQKLICSYNQIKDLDISHNPKLVYLDCADNQIKKLDLSHNPLLCFLQAFTNSFKTLDIGYNPFLIEVYKKGTKKSEAAVCKGHSWTIRFGGETSTGGDNLYFLCFDDAVKLRAKDKGAVLPGPEEEKYNASKDKDLVTRAMVIQTLYEMAGKPDPGAAASGFSDVKAGAFYEKAVIWGEKNHICVGWPYLSSDTFGVGKWIQRQDLAFMLMRYSEYKGYKRDIDFGRSDDYIDYYDIDYYAWEAVCWSATWHIMEGKGENGADKSQQRIDPHGTVTREEFVAIVKRLLEENGETIKKVPVPDKVDLPANKSADSAYKLKLSKKKLTLKKGKSRKIKARLIDKKTGQRISGKIRWKSDNKKVAKVKKGKITAVGKGSCTVRAYAKGVSAKVKVKVR